MKYRFKPALEVATLPIFISRSAKCRIDLIAIGIANPVGTGQAVQVSEPPAGQASTEDDCAPRSV